MRPSRRCASADDISGLGITNQRETTVWDWNTGEPVMNAIVAGHPHGPIVDEPPATAARTASRSRWACRWRPTSGPKVRWILDNVDGARGRPRPTCCSATSTPGASGTDRRHRRRHPHHRRLERQPHDADGPAQAGVGRGHRLDDRRPELDAAGDPRFQRRLRRGPLRRGAERREDRRRSRRPAGRDVRADVLRRRRGEEHVRHGQLPAAQHRHRGRHVEERLLTTLATRSATRTRSTASRARSRSPARWCSGCATT